MSLAAQNPFSLAGALNYACRAVDQVHPCLGRNDLSSPNSPLRPTVLKTAQTSSLSLSPIFVNIENKTWCYP